MGRELYETCPVFHETLNRCSEILEPYLEKSLLQVVYPAEEGASRIGETAFAQPALFALEYSLAELWRSWGIVPKAVLGHSVGEYVAACVAGVFSLEDGLKLVAQRGALMQALPKSGGMTAIHANESQVRRVITNSARELAIAAVNSPNNTVISGRISALEQAEAALAAAGMQTERLTTSHAFHSPMIEPMLAELEAAASSIALRAPNIALISNLTGGVIGEEIATAGYWRRHARHPVRFQAAMESLQQEGCDIFLEIGPKPTLGALGRESLAEGVGLFVPSLRPGRSDWQQMLTSLAELYVHGVEVDWRGFDCTYSRGWVTLPTYPFQRQTYWPDRGKSKPSLPAARGSQRKAQHPLLGERVQSVALNPKELLFESRLAPEAPSFLKDHRVFGQAVLPATAFLEMALAAGAAAFETSSLILEEVAILQPLILPENEERTTQTLLSPRDGAAEEYDFKIFSLAPQNGPDPSWTLHVTGRVRPMEAEACSPRLDLDGLRAGFLQDIPVEMLYAGFAERSLEYGPGFRGVVDLRQSRERTWARIELPESTRGEAGYYLHPALLDSCFQSMGPLFQNRLDTFLPVGFERLRFFHSAGEHVGCHARIGVGGDEVLTGELTIFDAAGVVIAAFEGMTIRRADREAVLSRFNQSTSDWFYEIAWREKTLPPKGEPHRDHPRRWLILDRDGLGTALARVLEENGDHCLVAILGESFHREGKGSFTVDLASSTDVRGLLEECGDAPLEGCIYLWSLGEESPSPRQSRFDTCAGLLHLVQGLAERGGGRLWIVTAGAQQVGSEPALVQAQQATLWGLGRVIPTEGVGITSPRLDLDPEADKQDHLDCLVQELTASDGEDQIAYRNGTRHVARLTRRAAPTASGESGLEVPSDAPYQLQISSYGTFENLRLAPMQRRTPGPGEMEIEVHASGLNFRDVLHALGMLPQAAQALGIEDAHAMPFGFECAGIVSAIAEDVSEFAVGQKVMAMAWGSMSSFLTVPAALVAAMPKDLSFEEAAALPLVFLTAIYGLEKLARIGSGDRVLIHAAAGGVGQAALQIAQRAGAVVFATAGETKWQRLKSQGVQHVMDSRSLNFADEILKLTNGEGVDIVLNSFSGEFIEQSMRVLNGKGRFVELGKVGVWTEEQVREVKPDALYFPFDLGQVGARDPKLIASMLRELSQALECGTLKPLATKAFPVRNAVAAFRHMAQAKHYGKIVLTCTPEASEPAPAAASLFRSETSYLITGGLGALGLEVARWMAAEGARRLILVSRRPASDVVQERLEELRRTGAEVIAISADVSQADDVARTLKTAHSESHPLRGVIHAAGVLDDGALVGTDWKRFRQAMAAKVDGSWHLHSLTRELPLDFFVFFSSASALLGTPGQGSYAAANAFMDALAHRRRGEGLPALSINWGPWADIGMAARMDQRYRSRIAQQGFLSIEPAKGVRALGELLRRGAVQTGVFPMNWATAMRQFPTGAESSFYAELAGEVRRREKPSQLPARQVGLLSLLKEASANRRVELLLSFLQSHLKTVLGMDPRERLDPDEPFAEMGLDSLMGIELKSRIGAELGIDVPLQKFVGARNLANLTALLLEQLMLARILPTETVATGEEMEEIVL